MVSDWRNTKISHQTMFLAIRFIKNKALHYSDKEDDYSLGMAAGMQMVAEQLKDGLHVGEEKHGDKLNYHNLRIILGIGD